MGLFGINDNLSTFALTKAKRAERKVLILSQEIDALQNKVNQIETILSNLNTSCNSIKNTTDDLVIRVKKLENI